MLCLGAVLLGVSLWELLHMAQEQQAVPGPEFQRSATLLRTTVVGEVFCLAVGALLVMSRTRSVARRLALLAISVWLLGVIDTLLIAQAGVIPR